MGLISLKYHIKELFLSKLDPGSPNPGGERKMSSASTTSMKTKWLKAFRSLKPAGSGSSGNDRKNGNANSSSQVRIDSDNHNLQEYTYKKITPCDVCSQVLRGHTRQGLRCRICKVNAHADCASQLPKCQVKAKLLRRQKSTSEIENRVEQEEEKPNDLDTIYKVLKKAGEISAAADKYNASGINNQQPTMDIPDIQVPDYPDRLTPRRGPFKSQGPISQSNRQGLTAPNITDVSSSDRQIGSTATTTTSAQDPGVGVKRRMFAGFRPLSGFGLLRMRSSQNRSISLPENEMTTRPFGQPLCLGSDDEQPQENFYANKGARRKK
ncbi:unnamed protein product [Diamesa hyperborea]